MTSDLDCSTGRGSSWGGFDDAIRALLARGWRFQQLHDDAGYVVALVGSYGWPGYYDCLHIHGEDDAAAARLVMAAGPGVDEVVWSYRGDVINAIRELLELPKPHDPNVPRHGHLWQPSPALLGLLPRRD